MTDIHNKSTQMPFNGSSQYFVVSTRPGYTSSSQYFVLSAWFWRISDSQKGLMKKDPASPSIPMLWNSPVASLYMKRVAEEPSWLGTSTIGSMLSWNPINFNGMGEGMDSRLLTADIVPPFTDNTQIPKTQLSSFCILNETLGAPDGRMQWPYMKVVSSL